MSSTSPESTPEQPAEQPAEQPEPDEHLLVDPTRVRRAPRYRGFFSVGAVVGIVVGVVLGVWLSGIATDAGSSLLKPGVFVSVIVLGTTAFFVLLAGAVALLADRRSLRRR
ncbi:histidine kinase [Isoptericola croceus]|uniref:histidine kinase n=1 Tax=Isoptericola croceus TaxID=3031406 RepID=UPI0023F7385C|nr:histidine kinase [Isoptericola croceus]